MVVRGATVVEEISNGFSAGSGSEPCSAEMRFQAGSVAKQVLAAAVVTLAQQGVLQLDQPIRSKLTKAPVHWGAMTLHQLLSHTAGMGHWGDIPGLPTSLSAPPERGDLVAMIARAPLVRPPGGGWGYSGPGFLLAALVVEAATGAAYGDVAADLVFRPAQMSSTTSGRFPAASHGVAQGHCDGQLLDVHEGFTQIPGTGDI